MNLEDIAKSVNGRLVGQNVEVSVLSSLDDVVSGSLVFITEQALLAKAESSSAAAILAPKEVASSQKPIIQVDNPKTAFFSLFARFYPKRMPERTIASSAVIAEDVEMNGEVSIGSNVVVGRGSVLGEGVTLFPGVVVGENVRLAKGVILHPNVTIYDDCELGEGSIVHANTVIGSDGFGYVFDGEKQQKIPHVGKVVIGKDVEIGANVTIDRATMGQTVIGDGSKIDNLVQIAHNVTLGKNNIVCALSGIAGSSKLGDNVVLAANVGIADHVVIEDNVVLGARSGVASNKTIRAGSRMLGAPAKDERKAIEIVMLSQRLPQMRKAVQSLQKRIRELESVIAKSEG